MACGRLCGIVCLIKCIVLLIFDIQDIVADWLLFKTFQEVEGYTLTIVLGVFMGFSTILLIVEIYVWGSGISQNCSKICSGEDSPHKEKVYMLKSRSNPTEDIIIGKKRKNEPGGQKHASTEELAQGSQQTEAIESEEETADVDFSKKDIPKSDREEEEVAAEHEVFAAEDEVSDVDEVSDNPDEFGNIPKVSLEAKYFYVSMDIPTLTRHDALGEIVNYLLLIFEDLPIVVLLNHVFAKGPCELYWVLFYSPAKVTFSLATTFLSATGKFLQAVLACCPCGCNNVFDIALHQKLKNHRTAAWCVIINSFFRLLLTFCLMCFAALTFFTYNCYGVFANPDCLEGNYTNAEIQNLKMMALNLSSTQKTIVERFGLELCPFST